MEVSGSGIGNWYWQYWSAIILFATTDIIVGKTCKRLCWEKIKFALRILFVVVLMYYLGWVGT